MEEYSDRFQDGELPEACLTDVLRARMPLATGLQCVAVITRLLQPGGVLLVDESAVQAATVKAEEADKARARKGASLAAVTSLAAAPEAAPIVVDASKAIKITLMKLVNKYAERDPTHFRQHTCTLKLQWRGMSAYAEVEVHYVEIMKVGISNNSSAYEHYNFFREKLKGTVPEGELDELLEEKLIFLVDATGIPVLLSLLVLIFTSGGEDLTKLPSNRIELYELGIESAIKKRLQRGQAAKGDVNPSDMLIRHWIRLFNLDRSNMNVDDNPQFEQKKEREHRPTRKQAMKFDDLRNAADQAQLDQKASEKVDGAKQSFKLDQREVYEVFRHGAHYLAEANKPEVQRTELNRIELAMPKKLVDTVMTLINTNLKLLLGGASPQFGLTMLRNVAVTNQQAGRREFSSAHVSVALLLEHVTAEGFTLWLHLNKEDAGLPLIKTLEAQTDLAPAQYQFKHLSFQEGLFAQHLLMQAKEGWEGWATDEAASKFINNPFMNNTCRIAAGHLGTLLAKRRPSWDFGSREARLTEVGLQALWLIMDQNLNLKRLSLTGNKVGAVSSDSAGLAKMLTTSTALVALDLSKNVLGTLKSTLRIMARGLSQNKSLTYLNISSNELWPDGTRIVCNALRACTTVRKVDLSYNHPGREASLASLFLSHPTLTSIGVIEAEPQSRLEKSFHLDPRAKEAIGRAILEGTGQVQFIQCDAFQLSEETTTLTWNSNLSSDAIMLAGVLKRNTVLTTLNVLSGKGEMSDSEREEVGRALLANKQGKVGFCDIFGLSETGGKTYRCDLRDKEQVRSMRSFTLLAGLLRANPILTSVELKSLSAEHVETLAEALKHNKTLNVLKLEHPLKGADITIATLPVQQLNGSKGIELMDLSERGEVVEGGHRGKYHMTRFACAMLGAVLAINRSVVELKVNPGPGTEGGAILDHLQRAIKSSLRTLDLTGIHLGERGGSKFFESLLMGACPNITTYKLGSTGLADHAIGPLIVEVLRSETCSITSLDLSSNQISGTVLARAIQLNHSITSLDVRDNPIDDQALWVLGNLLLNETCQCRLGYLRVFAFEVEESMKTLSMKDKPLESGAVRLLAGVVKFNQSLTALNLSATKIEKEAASSIAQALVANKLLAELDLSRNPMVNPAMYKLGDANDMRGLQQLADAVLQAASLKRLTLEGGELPVHFLRGMQEHSSASFTQKKANKSASGTAQEQAIATGAAVDLSAQKLTFVSAVVMAALIKDNKYMSELNIHGNELGPEGLKIIIEALRLGTFVALDAGGNVTPMMSGTKKAEVQNKQIADLFVSISTITSLERLLFDRNEVFEIAQDTISRLSSLKILSITHNKLVALPEDLWQLRSLKKLACGANKIRELHATVGQLESLESLDLRGNALTFLPTSIGQLQALRHLDLSENQLSQLVPTICELALLEKVEVKNNPLQRPPLSTAKQGMVAIRRYFQELARAGEAVSNAARLVLLGHGESGKTSLQRGLRAGTANPASFDERTIQLDIYSLLLERPVPEGTPGGGTEQITVSMWDLAGQPQYAAGLQPYIVSGSLYLLLVPALPILELDAQYGDLVGRWMDYLTASAPEAVVQPVITHCDRMLPASSKDHTALAFENAAAAQANWLCSALQRHQAFQLVSDGFKPLKVQEKVMCISAVQGGDLSLLALRHRLEEIVFGKPPLLPSVGQTIPKSWMQAMSFLRALRDGRNPVAAARNAVLGDVLASEGSGGMASGFSGGARPYVTMVEAEQIWIESVVPVLGPGASPQVLTDALQLLVNQGEVFSSSGIIYLQPDYITRLLKPLVDHRLTKQRFQQTLGALPGDADAQVRRAALLLPACEIFIKTGELREELLTPMWQPLGLHGDDYGDVVIMLAASGVLFLAEHTCHGRRWVMPMRLPPVRPEEVYRNWSELLGVDSSYEQLSFGYQLGRFAPPGVSERLVAACNGLGKYKGFWKRGALFNTAVPGAFLLLEMRSTQALTTVGESHSTHEQHVEVRAPRTARRAVWALLLRVHETAERIMEDFPGIRCNAEVRCPGCATNQLQAVLKAQTITSDADRAIALHEAHGRAVKVWPMDEVTSKRQVCELCGETLALNGIKLEDSNAAIVPLSQGLHVTPAPFSLEEAAVDSKRMDSLRNRSDSTDSFRHRSDCAVASPDKPGILQRDPSQPGILTRQLSLKGLGLFVASPSADSGADSNPNSAPEGMSRRDSTEGPEAASAEAPASAVGGASSTMSFRRRVERVLQTGDAGVEGGGKLTALTGEGQAKVRAYKRFLARHVRYGRPFEANCGLHRLLGLGSEEELKHIKDGGEATLVAEITKCKTAERDVGGFDDMYWLNYVQSEPAEERAMPAGMPAPSLDQGHTGMMLDDFVKLPTAAAAGLKRIHVLALRLYTTSVHQTLNRALREGCSPARPHPYPALVAWLCEALHKLMRCEAETARAEELAKARRGASASAMEELADREPAEKEKTRTVWRAVDMSDRYGKGETRHEHFDFSEFRSRGGTELGFVSTSPNRDVAEESAIPSQTGAEDAPGTAPMPLVLKVRADLQKGAVPGVDLSFLSVFPSEKDCVYPPGTYFEPRTGYEEPVVLPSGEEITLRVFEVVPRVSSLFLTW